MYIKKSRLVIGGIIIFIVAAIITFCFVNPFGISNTYDFLKFVVGTKLINGNYYEEPNSAELSNMALAGVAVGTGDPYTNYMWGDAAKRYMEDVSGNYCGIGMYIESDMEENLISVVSAIAGSPAEAAGIVTGDKILKIDGQPYDATMLSEASSYMRGEEGTEVVVTIKKAADGTESDITLVRSIIEIESVTSKMLDNGIGYMSITQFNEEVTQKVLGQINSLLDRGMRSLIIDLRNNPGGLLDEAVAVTSLFVPDDQVITYTLDRFGNKEEYKAYPVDGGEKISLPMVVLTNGGTASASEVLTGALKDYGLATVIGEKSFGKGVVQSVFEFAEDGVMSVTIARYYTPNGICIHGEGIEPDIISTLEPEKTANISNIEVSEDDQLVAAIDYLNK